jgi:hypothetical protein
VCQLQHVKVGAMIKAYKELGIWGQILAKINQTKADALREMEKMLYPGANQL